MDSGWPERSPLATGHWPLAQRERERRSRKSPPGRAASERAKGAPHHASGQLCLAPARWSALAQGFFRKFACTCGKGQSIGRPAGLFAPIRAYSRLFPASATNASESELGPANGTGRPAGPRLPAPTKRADNKYLQSDFVLFRDRPQVAPRLAPEERPESANDRLKFISKNMSAEQNSPPSRPFARSRSRADSLLRHISPAPALVFNFELRPPRAGRESHDTAALDCLAGARSFPARRPARPLFDGPARGVHINLRMIAR